MNFKQKLSSPDLWAWIGIFAILLFFVFLAATVHAAQIQATWSPVETATGYKLYYGTQSGALSNEKDAQDKTTLTFELPNGFYYFAVSAYNEHGDSGKSNEVSALILSRPGGLSVAVTVP